MKKDKMNILERMRHAPIGDIEAMRIKWTAWTETLSEEELTEHLDDISHFTRLIGLTEDGDPDLLKTKILAFSYYTMASWRTKVATGAYPLTLAYQDAQREFDKTTKSMPAMIADGLLEQA